VASYDEIQYTHTHAMAINLPKEPNANLSECSS